MLNEKQQLVLNYACHTGEHIFLTGKAGTGKTTLLKEIVAKSFKNIVVAAPTGIAAINAKGVTLHSLFQLPFGTFLPEEWLLPGNDQSYSFLIHTPQTLKSGLKMHQSRRQLLRELELLIIDEISMARPDMMDAIDTTLQFIRHDKRPFGGVQLLLVGDLYQLPPVIKHEEWKLLKQVYQGQYFFNARVFQQLNLLNIKLDKVYRQEDAHFISLLNKIRKGDATADDVVQLNKNYVPNLTPSDYPGYIQLTTHNRYADTINEKQLATLKSETHHYTATITGDFPEHTFPVNQELALKIGAQVMLIKNDMGNDRRYYNGKIGAIHSLSTDVVTVLFENEEDPVKIEPYLWRNVTYKLNAANGEIVENEKGTFSQLPIKLAWAITVHKSQGLTFDKAIIDVSRAFADGQVYVALSRLRSQEGMLLTEKIPLHNRKHDDNIVQLERQEKNQDELTAGYDGSRQQFLFTYLPTLFNTEKVLLFLHYHIGSYNKKENLSRKQQHSEWAKAIREDFTPINKTAMNFCNWLALMSQSKENLTLVIDKTIAATDYFSPKFTALMERITLKIEEINQNSGVKKYRKELSDLKLTFSRQLKQMERAKAFVIAHRNNKTLQRNDIYTLSPKKKATSKKESKIPTTLITYNLLCEGNSLEEIISIRKLTSGTIIGHLSPYIKNGDIDPTLLLSTEKLTAINTYLQDHPQEGLSQLKRAMGNNYSYEDIRIGIAAFEAKKEEK